MPILAETGPIRKRHAPLWALLLVLGILLFGGVLAWSCYQPISLSWGNRGFAFGRIPGASAPPWQIDRYSMSGNYGVRFKVPGGQETGWYGVAWYWP